MCPVATGGLQARWGGRRRHGAQTPVLRRPVGTRGALRRAIDRAIRLRRSRDCRRSHPHRAPRRSGEARPIVELLDFEWVQRHGAVARPCDPGNGHFLWSPMSTLCKAASWRRALARARGLRLRYPRERRSATQSIPTAITSSSSSRRPTIQPRGVARAWESTATLRGTHSVAQRPRVALTREDVWRNSRTSRLLLDRAHAEM
jgi:hypothetical protein